MVNDAPIFVMALQDVKHSCATLCARITSSSLGRSGFCGVIQICHDMDEPFYKVSRTQVEEYTLEGLHARGEAQDSTSRLIQYLCELKPREDQWVVVCCGGGMAVRNIDHLLTSGGSGRYAPPEIDFLWASIDDDPRRATRGIWAVRGKHLASVVQLWKEHRSGKEKLSSSEESEVWQSVLIALPLRKKRFERGEISAPALQKVNWPSIMRSAFVTVPDWPAQDQFKFLQSLYMGVFLGDESALFLGIIDP